jgi:polar amino acid transport system substrate-binding protein
MGRDALVPYQKEIPGTRLLDGYSHKTGIAMAAAKNRPAGLAHVRTFIEGAKAGGLVRRTLDKAGLRDTAVAPAE